MITEESMHKEARSLGRHGIGMRFDVPDGVMAIS
jgi:hypothetical protein